MIEKIRTNSEKWFSITLLPEQTLFSKVNYYRDKKEVPKFLKQFNNYPPETKLILLTKINLFQLNLS